MQDILLFITHHAGLSLTAGILIFLVFLIELLRMKRGSSAVTPLQAIQMINRDNAVVVDIRPQEIYRQGHIIAAQSLTPKEIQDSTKKLERFKTKPLIVVCATSVESRKIAALLLKQGYNARALSGGIRAWNEANMPLVKE